MTDFSKGVLYFVLEQDCFDDDSGCCADLACLKKTAKVLKRELGADFSHKLVTGQVRLSIEMRSVEQFKKVWNEIGACDDVSYFERSMKACSTLGLFFEYESVRDGLFLKGSDAIDEYLSNFQNKP